VDVWECGGKVTKGNVCCKTLLCYVVLDDGEQAIYCIVDLSARACSELILCQRIVDLCEFCQPRNNDSLKQFSQCATSIYATI